jgi:hypothetical protein
VAEDSINDLELRVALGASEERQRHEVALALKEFKDDVRRDIRLYVGLGVACGNAVAAYVIAKWGPSTNTVPAAARAVRHFVGL